MIFEKRSTRTRLSTETGESPDKLALMLKRGPEGEDLGGVAQWGNLSVLLASTKGKHCHWE